MISYLALALASPWIVVPVATVLRMRQSRMLSEESDTAPPDAPSVTVVIPARNEVRNIERCVRAVLSSTYPRLNVIVVDDHSTDGTSELLAALTQTDTRLRVTVPDPLPHGWFGKQWACSAGARLAGGEIIGFLDADTWQSPDMITRLVNAMRSRSADMMTVGGQQEMVSFWERIIQPQVFGLLLIRYGGSEIMNASRHKRDKIANGQCIFVKRSEYERLGGHGAVREKVAEDLALAQLYFSEGLRTFLIVGFEQFSTRMYGSLRDLINGWGKNFYVGGRDAMPGGATGRFVYPFVLLSPWLAMLAPLVILLLAGAGVLHGMMVQWAALVAALYFVCWIVFYAFIGHSLLYALLYPLGAAMMLYISARSIAKGRRVQWKSREYVVPEAG